MNYYSIHPQAAIFRQKDIDKLNKFTTLIYDWKNNIYFSINKPSYMILQYIFLRKKVSMMELIEFYSKTFQKNHQVSSNTIKQFCKEMLKNNILKIEK